MMRILISVKKSIELYTRSYIALSFSLYPSPCYRRSRILAFLFPLNVFHTEGVYIGTECVGVCR